MLSNFIDVIRGQQDRAVVATLNDLCGLFALQDMMEGRGWVGILSRETMSLVESGVDVLLGRLRPNAVTLVDAFDIPDRILNSSIGRSDGNVYVFFSLFLFHLAKRQFFSLSFPCALF